MLFRIRALCGALFTVIVFSSCSREDSGLTQQQNPCIYNTHTPADNFGITTLLAAPGYDSAFCGLMPMKNGAYWVFTDSLFNASGTLTGVTTDTLKITAAYRSPADRSIWWNFFSLRKKGMRSQALTTDSVVYFLDIPNLFPPVFRLNRWLHIPAADTIARTANLSDVAYMERNIRLPGAVTVPAGSYTGCISISKFWGTYSETMTIKPGTGIIAYRLYDAGALPPYLFTHGAVRQVSVLTSFQVF
ncbi:MAG: hypothetical protein JNM68_11695 [Dinghuibacter sp.]|nr:hypothetical protein [Dinghuibacter sp.]